MVWKAHPILWCASCGNRYCGGLWRQVELPPNIAAIEALLTIRPFPLNQNWEPGEPIEQLASENEVLLPAQISAVVDVLALISRESEPAL